MWRDVKIQYKLITLVVCAAIALALASAGALMAMWNVRLEERKFQLRNISEIAQEIIKLQSHQESIVNGETAIARISKILSSVTYNNGEYIFLISNDGTFLAHPNAEMIGKNFIDLKDRHGTPIIRNLLAASKQEGGGFTEYYWTKAHGDVPTQKLSFAISIPQLNAFVGTGTYIDDLWADFIHDASIIAIVDLFIFAGLCALAMVIARSISRPVTDLVSAMNGMADGDMTVLLPCQSRRDETGALAKAAEQMRSQLHALSAEVRTHARRVYGVAQKIAMAVEGQAVTASQMSASVAEISATMEQLSASSTQIAENSNTVVSCADLTWENSKKGQEAMQLVTTKMAGTREDNESSLRDIIELGSRSKEISKIMQMINTIAAQTKLIAFNAALEAASAGEAGRRFGVVAAEIRRLADNVTESTGEIEGRVNQIQDSINRLVITSEKGAKGIAEGMAALAHTADLLDELVDAARQTTTAAKQISLSTQQQQTASNQVVMALREIVTASSHTARSITEISENSKGMAEDSSELDRLVGRIRINPHATSPADVAGEPLMAPV